MLRSGEVYKQTVINESIENDGTFSTIIPLTRFILDYIFPPRMAPATSSRTYNFAKIISVAHLPRIFIANALIATAFTGHGKSPLTIEHIILSNKISPDWNRS